MKVLNSYITGVNCKQMYPQDQARNVHRSTKNAKEEYDMKIVTYEVENKTKLGIFSADGQWVYPLECFGIEYQEMQEAIAEMSDSEIDPKKDLDGISPENIAKVFAGDSSGFAPCTAEAVMEVLRANEIPVEGKRVTVVGRSMVVGKPLAMLMLKANGTVTMCHTRTRDLKGACQNAEILVAAAGKAKMLNGDYVGQDAVVLDVGINVDEDGKLCGDVDFGSLEGKAAAATPVPGGVGAVTTAVLAKHLVQAAQRR